MNYFIFYKKLHDIYFEHPNKGWKHYATSKANMFVKKRVKIFIQMFFLEKKIPRSTNGLSIFERRMGFQ